ncbi:MAG: hypothetical protein P8Z80_05715 [Pseudolabrys sp.]
MSKRLIIGVTVTVLAAMASSVASAGDRNDVLPASDIALSLLSYGLAPESDAVLHGPYYVLHAWNPRGREVRVVADAHFGDILSIVPVHSWRTYPLRRGSIARIIDVPEDVFGRRGAAPSSGRQRGRSDEPRRKATGTLPPRADDDAALTPIHSTPDFGLKVDGAKSNRLPSSRSQHVE